MDAAFAVIHEQFEPVMNELGEHVDAWAPPVEVPVFGWGPPASDDVIRGTQSGYETREVLYAPTGFARHRDRITLPDGRVFLAQGTPRDFNNGPFGWRPGYAIDLTSVEG